MIPNVRNEAHMKAKLLPVIPLVGATLVSFANSASTIRREAIPRPRNDSIALVTLGSRDRRRLSGLKLLNFIPRSCPQTSTFWVWASNACLRLRCVGTRSNPSAIGAKVRPSCEADVEVPCPLRGSHPVATGDMNAPALRFHEKFLGKAVFLSFLWLAANANAALPTIEFIGGSVPEDIGAGDFLLSRRGDASGFATVGYTVVPETAQAGVDYEFQNGQLTFMPREIHKLVSIPIFDNGLLDGDRMFRVILTNFSGAEPGNRTNATVTILDNEIPPLIDRSFHPFSSSAEFCWCPEPTMTVALQQDGRILSGRMNEGSTPALVRSLPDGSLDSTFNSEVPYTRVEDILVEPDQRVLVVGETNSGAGCSITRLETSGRIDQTFKAIFLGNSYSRHLEIGPDGESLFWGAYGGIHKVNSNGALESLVLEAFCGEVHAFAAQPDGKILLGGWSPNECDVAHALPLLRFNADGTLDRTFNVTLAPPTESDGATVEEVLVAPDGRIHVAGRFGGVNGQPGQSLARLNADGTVDPTFHFQANMPSNWKPVSAALDSEGRVLISFWAGLGWSELLRFNADGSSDGTFHIRSGYEIVNETVAGVQPDGKILVSYFAENKGVRLARVLPDPENGNLFSYSPDGGFTEPSAFPLTASRNEVTVFRLGPTLSSMEIGYTTRDGTARAGTDYIAQSGTIHFLPLQTSVSFRIQTPTNSALKQEKSFYLVLTNQPSGTSLGLYSELQIRLIPSEIGNAPVPVPKIIVKAVPQPGFDLRLLLTNVIAGAEYAIESSSHPDFRTHSEILGPKYNSDDTIVFHFPIDPTTPQRFYRARYLGFP